MLKQWLTAVLVIIWFTLCQSYFRWPYAGGILVLVAIVAYPLVLRLLHRIWPHSWSTVGSVAIIMVTAMVAASFMTSNLTRQLLAVASAGLLFVLLQGPAAAPLTGLQGRLTLFAMTAGYWFGWVGLLSVSIFLNWPIWVLAGLSAGLTTAVAAVVWFDGGVPAWKVRRGLWLPAWLGLELWLAIWALPTSILVGSVVATAAVMLWLQICRHVWLHTWRPDRGRRYVFVGSLVVAIALLTARWV